MARHDRPTGPMETIDHGQVTASEGLHGDFRGGLASTRPGRKRQVSVLEMESWQAALTDGHAWVDWWHSRRNLLVEGANLPHASGTRLQIGESLVLEVTGECFPCERMDALHDGLRAALTPHWRGGFTCRVVADGTIALGDTVRIL